MTDEKPADVPQGMFLLGSWIDRTFRLWAVHWRRWLALGLAYTAVMLSMSLLLRHLAGAPWFAQSSKEWTSNRQWATYLLSITGALLPLRALFDPAIITLALADTRGLERTPREVVAVVRRWFLPALALYAISLLLFLLGVAALVVGALYVAASLLLALPLLIDQQTGLRAAIGGSWHTVSRNFWLYLAFFVFFLFLSIATGPVLQPFNPTQSVWGLGFNLVVGALTLPLLPIAQAVAYAETFSSDATMKE
jgi:uncharacterized membrane protein